MAKTTNLTKYYPYIILTLLIIVSLSFLFYRSAKRTDSPANPTPTALLKTCPEKWIVNKMPQVGETPANQNNAYYILNGARAEIKDFDSEWVKQNCQLSPEFVY